VSCFGGDINDDVLTVAAAGCPYVDDDDSGADDDVYEEFMMIQTKTFVWSTDVTF
jgi:hypothetical protein